MYFFSGRSLAQIKIDASKLGDLGIVAETSRGGQRVMFQPAPLTIPKVFNELKSIANLKGNKVQDAKCKKIQGMLVACKQSEARYLIRSLAGKLRIGLAEQSVLQALAQACVMTPPAQEYPPEIRMVNFSFKKKIVFFVKLKFHEKKRNFFCEIKIYFYFRHTKIKPLINSKKFWIKKH